MKWFSHKYISKGVFKKIPLNFCLRRIVTQHEPKTTLCGVYKPNSLRVCWHTWPIAKPHPSHHNEWFGNGNETQAEDLARTLGKEDPSSH